MSTQISEQDFYDMRNQRDVERTKNLGLQIEVARLTAANEQTNNLLDEQGTHINEQSLKIAYLAKVNESMQDDAVQNTYAFGLMLKANKEQAEEIRTLKQALTDIRATTVTLGDSQSAWKAWRKCSYIAGEALK